MIAGEVMTMVERVARAISAVDGDYSTYGEMARAAIAAMREPTEEMLSALTSPADPVSAAQWREYARNDWIRMIDVALAEDQDTAGGGGTTTATG